MRFVQLILLYFCTVVCTLYLVSGGYKVIRNYIRKRLMPRRRKKSAPASQPEQNPKSLSFRSNFLNNTFQRENPMSEINLWSLLKQ